MVICYYHDNGLPVLGKECIMTGSLSVKCGKYYAVLNLKNEKGKRKQKWVFLDLDEKGNKRRAEKMLRDLLDQYEYKDLEGEAQRYVLSTCIMEWLALKKPQIDMITYELYESIALKHLVPYFQKLKLDIRDVTHQHLQEYFNSKFANGKIRRTAKAKSQKEPMGLSTESLKKHKIVLTQTFQNAVLGKVIVSNPVSHVKIPKSQTKKESVFYTVEQANELLRHMEGELLRPVVVMALYYGLRRSEILGLKWSAIDFGKNIFSINHTVVKSNKGTLYKNNTKTEASRSDFPILGDVCQMLIDLKNQQAENRNIFGNTYVESEYVFTWQDGKLITPDYTSRKFKKLLRQYDMPMIKFHNLRHSTASILVAKGFDIKSIQMWLRHADVRTTLSIYAHVSENQKQTIANDIQNMFAV